MKKLSFIFLALLMSLMASAVNINGIYYKLDSSTKQAEVVAGEYGGYTGNVSILKTLTYEGVTYSVTSIGERAFFSCSQLTSITIPNSITSIGKKAFSDCSSLTSVHITDLTAWCKIKFQDNPLRYAKHLFLNGKEIKDLVIPNNVTSISDEAFKEWPSLNSVTFGNSVTSIGIGSFANCTGLTSVTIPNSVTEIGGYAFYDCTGLTSVTIGNHVTTIGDKAFCGCSGLTSIAIPSSVTSIGNAFYEGCINLKKVELNSNAIVSKTYNTTTSNDYSIKNMFGTQVTEYILGDSVKAIGEKSFQYCTDLTSVTIPNSVTEIGAWAFGWCSKLTSVTLGNSVTKIGDYAFYWCEGLTSVHITDIAAWCKISFGEGSDNERYSSPLYYAKHLFMDGKEITDLVIPDSVTCIKNHVFHGWSNLTSVTIGKNVTEIGNNAFAECPSLTKVILNSNNIASQSFTSSSITTFFGTQVTEYILGDNVKAIGEFAFKSCFNLTSVTIPNSVTEIGTYAFRRCSGLTSVICKATSVPSTPSNAFYNVTLGNVTLYVPASAIEDYKATAPWSGFGTIVAIADVVRGDANGDGKVDMNDMTFITNIILGTEAATEAADVNNDGKINMPDAMFIVNKILNGNFPDE